MKSFSILLLQAHKRQYRPKMNTARKNDYYRDFAITYTYLATMPLPRALESYFIGERGCIQSRSFMEEIRSIADSCLYTEFQNDDDEGMELILL